MPRAKAIPLSPDSPAVTFARWMRNGDTWIGVFENAALDSADMGRKLALPFDTSLFDGAVIGKDHAPDTSIGLGWKYILVAKCRSVEEALTAMDDET